MEIKPKDVVVRNQLRTMTDKEITKEMSKTISSLNKKLKQLEKGGYAGYNYSYSRIIEYAEKQLKSHYFSSKSVKNASREKRIEFLTMLKHYDRYMLNTKGTKKMLEAEAKRLSQRLSEKNNAPITISIDDLITLKNALKTYKEETGHLDLYHEFGSPEMQEYFGEHIDMSPSQIREFIDGLKQYDGDKTAIILYKDYYDPNLGIPIKTENNIDYNPITSKIYDSFYEETDYIYDNGKIYKDNQEVDYIDFLKNSR